MANLCFVGRCSINRNSAKVSATVPSRVLICSARPSAALCTQQVRKRVVETIKRIPCARVLPLFRLAGIRRIKEYYSTPYDRTEPRNPNCFIADRSLESEDAGRIEEGLGGAHLAHFRLTPLCAQKIASDVGAARLFSQKGSAPS